MGRLRYYVVVVLLVCLSRVLAQPADSAFYAKQSRITWQYIGSGFSDLIAVPLAPLHWSGSQWVAFGGFAGTETALFFLDSDIQSAFPHNSSTALSEIDTYFFDPLGKGVITLPLLAGCYLYGIPSNNHRLQFTALTAVKSWAVAVSWTYAIKFLTHRERPQGSGFYDPNQWHGPSFDTESDNLSFISAHSASIFSIATVMASEYRDIAWVPWVAYGLAGATSLSRIYVDKHWSSDVLAGSILGFAIGKMVWNRARNQGGTRKQFSVTPITYPYGGGVQLVWNIPVK